MSERRALITGITGQDGSYLAELLLEKGYEVHGMVRRSSTETFQRLAGLPRRHHPAHRRPARPALARGRAARVRAAGDLQPRRDVVRGGLVVPACPDRRVHRDGSHADARGDARGRPGCALLPGLLVGDVREGAGGARSASRTPFYPRSPYGVAKCYGHFITVNYRESYDLFACSGILFNHECLHAQAASHGAPRRGPVGQDARRSRPASPQGAERSDVRARGIAGGVGRRGLDAR